MNTYVTPHLTGGLGNRLFQFAAALGLSEEYTIPCVFTESNISKNDHGPPDSICKLYPQIPRIIDNQSAAIYEEARGGCFIYQPFPIKPLADRVVIDGWRQTEKYFPKQKSLLNPSWSTLLTAQEQQSLLEQYNLISEEGKKNTWFIHVRLGDYKILPHHQIPVIPYYQACLNEVPKNSKVYLFSDEPHLCAQWVDTQCKGRNLAFDICNETNEINALFVMSNCHGGAIVANSTFSWWGAYFSWLQQEQPETFKAFYPSVWGQGLPPARDVVPSFGTSVAIEL